MKTSIAKQFKSLSLIAHTELSPYSPSPYSPYIASNSRSPLAQFVNPERRSRMTGIL